MRKRLLLLFLLISSCASPRAEICCKVLPWDKADLEKHSLSARAMKKLEDQGWNKWRILTNLYENSHLIPYESQSGSRHIFASYEDTYILNNHLIHAYFEDGHIYGFMLLSYHLNGNGISFQAIKSCIDCKNNYFNKTED